jgi:hypothetical protein
MLDADDDDDDDDSEEAAEWQQAATQRIQNEELARQQRSAGVWPATTCAQLTA